MLIALDIKKIGNSAYKISFDGRVNARVVEDLILAPPQEIPTKNDAAAEAVIKSLTFSVAKGSLLLTTCIEKNLEQASYPYSYVFLPHPMSGPALGKRLWLGTIVKASYLYLPKIMIRGIRYFRGLEDKNPRVLYDGKEDTNYYQGLTVLHDINCEEFYNYVMGKIKEGNLRAIGKQGVK